MDESQTLLQLDDLKAAHRAMWSCGDYTTVADTVIPRLGETLVDACAPSPNDHVLDLACGSGNATLPAARLSATVTAVDLSDSLLATCAQRARAERLDVTCVPADVEDLPFSDSVFDMVLSCVGVMFAPHHHAAANELLRVCRPGGTVGLLSWSGRGFIGQLLAAMRPFVPQPPPGAQPPALWADVDHVRELVGKRLGPLSTRTDVVRVTAFEQPADFRRFFADSYGPMVAAFARLSDDAARTRELEDVIDDLAHRHWQADGSMEWEYVIVTATRLSEEDS